MKTKFYRAALSSSDWLSERCGSKVVDEPLILPLELPVELVKRRYRPMLGTVVQAPAWKQQGRVHVCLACRRHQRITALQRRQQYRHHSELAHTSSSAGADEWFNNLNDISDTYGRSPKRRHPSPPLATAQSDENATKHSTTEQSPRNGSSHLRRSLNTKTVEHRTSQKNTRRERVRKEAKQDARRKAFSNSPPRPHNAADLVRALARARPLPKFTGAPTLNNPIRSILVDSVAVPSRQDSPRKANTDKHVPEKKYKARTSPAASGLVRRIEIADVLSGSLSNRLKMQKARTPYGFAKVPPGTPAKGASFTSFREADRVSPDRPIPTSAAVSPFGMPIPRDNGRGQFAASSSSATTSSSFKQEATTSMSSLLGRPNQIVKEEMLFGSGETAMNKFPPRGDEQENRNRHLVEQEQQHDILVPEQEVSVRTSRNDMGKPDVQIDVAESTYSSDELKQEPVGVNGPAHASPVSIHNSKSLLGAPGNALPTETVVGQPSAISLAAASVSAAASCQAPSSGSEATGSGDDGSENPPGDFSGVSLAQALKSSRQPRARRTRRSSSKRSQVAQAKHGEEPHDARQEEQESQTGQSDYVASISPADLHIEPLDIPQPHVPYLEYGLDRVLFNPGIYQLQDHSSRVYNFDPYLQDIMPVNEFDFNALKEYKTSSQDKALSTLAKCHDKKYIGSTSSMTSSLAHFHYLLSNWRPINLSTLSDDFVSTSTKTNMTEINRAPSAIFLRWKNGTYAIDADKEFDGANVLMLLGKSMELLLTLPKSDYERYRKSDPRQVPEEQKTAPESYQYTTMRDFLMRSQLDAYDPRLPGNGTFDLKTRAVVSVRMQAKEFEPMTGYEIFSLHGKWNSYEREYYDMMRSTMLKYMLQARMGRMNGIFVAYHNVKRIFGFQYIPMHELDRALHGQVDTCLGDQEFRASLDMLNEVLNKATMKYPEQSLRIHFETQEQKDGMPTALHVFAEPIADEDIDRIQNTGKAKIAAFERDIMGKDSDIEVDDPDSEPAPIAAEDKEAESRSAATDDANLGIASSDSNADTEFLNTIESSSGEELKPLFYATIIAQSRINGEIPDDDRPTNLKNDDKWEIDYILKEYEVNRHQWALYEDMKARRKFKFSEGREDEDEGDPESEGQSKRSDGFIQMLRGLSDKSRETRTRIDELDAGREQVWVGKGLSHDREQIEGVEDYMKWLYRAKVEA